MANNGNFGAQDLRLLPQSPPIISNSNTPTQQDRNIRREPLRNTRSHSHSLRNTHSQPETFTPPPNQPRGQIYQARMNRPRPTHYAILAPHPYENSRNIRMHPDQNHLAVVPYADPRPSLKNYRNDQHAYGKEAYYNHAPHFYDIHRDDQHAYEKETYYHDDHHHYRNDDTYYNDDEKFHYDTTKNIPRSFGWKSPANHYQNHDYRNRNFHREGNIIPLQTLQAVLIFDPISNYFAAKHVHPHYRISRIAPRFGMIGFKFGQRIIITIENRRGIKNIVRECKSVERYFFRPDEVEVVGWVTERDDSSNKLSIHLLEKNCDACCQFWDVINWTCRNKMMIRNGDLIRGRMSKQASWQIQKWTGKPYHRVWLHEVEVITDVFERQKWINKSEKIIESRLECKCVIEDEKLCYWQKVFKQAMSRMKGMLICFILFGYIVICFC